MLRWKWPLMPPGTGSDSPANASKTMSTQPRACTTAFGTAAPYVVIDRSLFATAPDLPGIDTTPAPNSAVGAAAVFSTRVEPSHALWSSCRCQRVSFES